jgi:hypothetical protein
MQIFAASVNDLANIVSSCPNLKILRLTFNRPSIISEKIQIVCKSLRMVDLSNLLASGSVLAFLGNFQLEWLRLNFCYASARAVVKSNWDACRLEFIDVSCKSSSTHLTRFIDSLIDGAQNFNPKDVSLPCLTFAETALLGFSLKRLKNFCCLDWRPEEKPTAFSALIQANVQTLRVLVLQIKGNSRIHFDQLLYAISKAGKPPLVRMEISLVMSDTGVMEQPCLDVNWSVYFRCMYPLNKYFRRKPYSVKMREGIKELPEVTGPSELFALEMGVEVEEWGELSEARRIDYVAIIDHIFSTGKKQPPPEFITVRVRE